MDFKKQLVELKNKLLLQKLSGNLDYEFETELEDHPIGNQDIYRLYYVNYHRIGERYTKKPSVGRINWPCKPFKLPEGMTREEAFKVLSYLTDCIEKEEDTEMCSLKSVKLLDSILYLERLGFKRVKEIDESKIINLFTVSGRILLFKKCELYSKYFEWYVENVTLDEVVDIYAKCNMEFKDIVWVPKDKGQQKVLMFNQKK